MVVHLPGCHYMLIVNSSSLLKYSASYWLLFALMGAYSKPEGHCNHFLQGENLGRLCVGAHIVILSIIIFKFLFLQMLLSINALGLTEDSRVQKGPVASCDYETDQTLLPQFPIQGH